MTTTVRHGDERATPARPGPAGGDRGGLGPRVSEFVDRHLAAVFITPAVIFVVVMMVVPVVFTVWMSLHNWGGGAVSTPRFIGLDNFVRVLTADTRFWAALVRTFVFTALAVAVETVLGVAIAVLLNREFLGKGVLRTVFLFPMIATPVAIALVWRLMYEPNLGILNQLLTSVGLPPSEWVANASIVLPALALVDVWEWTPLITLITLAGLSALPNDPFEAAAIDGAGRWQTFRHITLPMLRPVIVVAVVFRLIDALKTFDIIYVVTQGGPGFASETLNLYVYAQSFDYQNLGYAASLLIVFFAVVVGSAVLLLRFRRAED
ncbi:MAG: carbohydrate ABC transporter permease [Egibacteraceae bacterium]